MSAAPPEAAPLLQQSSTLTPAAGSAIGSLRAGSRCRSGTPAREASRRSKANSFPEVPTLRIDFWVGTSDARATMARVTEKQCFRCAHDLLSRGYRRLGDHPGPKRHHGPGDEFEQCRFLWTDQPRHSGRENTSARAHTRGLDDAQPVEVLHTEALQHPEII